MNMEDLFSRMKEIGFTEVAPVKIEDLVPMPEIREMCAVDRCGSYGRKWSCPPYCGTLEECTARIQAHQSGIIMTTAVKLEDSFDYEGMQEGGRKHQQQFCRLWKNCAPNTPICCRWGRGAAAIVKPVLVRMSPAAFRRK